MATKTTRILSEEVLGPPDADGDVPVLVTSVWYEKGGTNYFSGDANPRGYYLAVRPETRRDRGNGVVIRSFVLFEGLKRFLEPAKAFSAKRLAALAPPADVIATLRGKVLAERATRAAKAHDARARDAYRLARDREEGTSLATRGPARRDPSCESCDCADPTALPGLAAECDCTCHRGKVAAASA